MPLQIPMCFVARQHLHTGCARRNEYALRSNNELCADLSRIETDRFHIAFHYPECNCNYSGLQRADIGRDVDQDLDARFSP